MDGSYTILGLLPFDGKGEIRRSYERKVFRLHPEKSKGKIAAAFQKLDETLEILQDDNSLWAYDTERSECAIAIARTGEKRKATEEAEGYDRQWIHAHQNQTRQEVRRRAITKYNPETFAQVYQGERLREEQVRGMAENEEHDRWARESKVGRM
jgi:curved DNA-binding protein CbpA